MGDPTQPGDDQETTIIIEGPPANGGTQRKRKGRTKGGPDFDSQFLAFKREVRSLFDKYSGLKIRVRNIKYIKKGK